MKELGLYIHIPFCVSKCYYCNFNSYANMDNLKEKYLKAIINEITAFSSDCQDYVVTTIYIGGGTPSNFISGGIKNILNIIKSCYKLSNECEISIEANPNTVTLKRAKEWKDAGINRVSIGLQSYNDKLLNTIGRIHTKKDYLNAIEIIKSVGINNISTDIMLGLPGQKLSDVKTTLKAVLKQGVKHISAYSLILEEDTPLYKMVQNGLKTPSEDKVLKMYDYVLKKLRKCGFSRYEVSNFSLNGYECKHNLNCWNMVEYVGFGAGANSYFKGYRFARKNNITDYINNLDSFDYNEKQSKLQLFNEYVMLKLRTSQGIDLNKIIGTYDVDLLKDKSTEIAELKNLGLIEIKEDYLFATDTGFKVLNHIILELVK